jgi:hypothetical protein
MTELMSATNLKVLAHALTDRGMRVFPVFNKRPVKGMTGYHGYSPYSHAEIDAMPWRMASHVGAALPPGLIAIDIDVSSGKLGRDQLQTLERLHGPLPETLAQTTPSAGEHRVFALPTTPDDAKLRSHPAMEGVATKFVHIDLIHAKHRFMTIYEPEKFAEGWTRAAVVPSAWLPALTRQAGVRHSMSSTVPEYRGAHELLRGRVASMAQVPEGYRNETLFGIAADLARFCGVGTASELELRRAALDSGLDPAEVGHSMAQGFTAGARQREPFDLWMAQHRRAICGIGPRTRFLVEAAMMHIARTLIVSGRTWNEDGEIVGYFSGRSLAHALGVGAGTAQRVLTTMLQLGILQKVNPGAIKGRAATEYRLTGIDSETNWSTLPSSLSDGSNKLCVLHLHPGREFPDFLTLPALLEHNIFRNARDGGLSLSKSIAFTLYAIMTHGDRLQMEDLATTTGFSDATAFRHLAVLIDFGFVSVSAYGSIHLSDADVFTLLDALEATCVVPDRRARQAAAFETARQAIDARQFA